MKEDFRFDDGQEELDGFRPQQPPEEPDLPAADEKEPAESAVSGDSDWSYDSFFREEDSQQADAPAPGQSTRTFSTGEVQRAAAPSPRGPVRKRKKTGGCLKPLIWVLVVAVISIGLAVGIIMAMRDVLALGKSATPEVVEIKPGMSTTQIAQVLKEKGIIDMPMLFRVYVKLMKYDGTFRYGVYYFSPSQGYEAVSERLQKEGKQAESTKITIKEGEQLNNIFALIAEKGICSKENLKSAMNNEKFTFKFLEDIPADKVRFYLEGYLFPDTYEFFPDDSITGAKMVINTMLENLDKKLTAADYAEAKRRKLTMHEIITMASIVELEASGRKDEMSKVASVFFNRLAWTDQPKLLGSTPTKTYAKAYGDDRYDTNKHPGLPPGPLNSPSLNAIKAALYPEKGFAYSYFVTDAKMQFYYNKTLAEHDATVNRLKKDNNWIY